MYWKHTSGLLFLSLLPKVHIFSLLKGISFFFCLCSFWFFPFVWKKVFCIHCQSFIRENLDHAYYLSRICCCSCHYSWICAFCCKLILSHMDLWARYIFFFPFQMIIHSFNYHIFSCESVYELGYCVRSFWLPKNLKLIL